MQLPGRLRSTTLGDLLGALHRARAHGHLELLEDHGRAHRVHFAQGLVVAVEFDGATASLAEILRSESAVDDGLLRRSLLRAIASGRLHGEVLIADFHLSSDVVDRALRRQNLARLTAIGALGDARLVFRVAMRPPRRGFLSAPLQPSEFLRGRRRARDLRRATSAAAKDRDAWHVLGLSPGTQPPEIKRAYRRLARSVHPDLHPQATADERRALESRFVQITQAYRALLA
jgi:DnaJ-domain-containing protein 1